MTNHTKIEMFITICRRYWLSCYRIGTQARVRLGANSFWLTYNPSANTLEARKLTNSDKDDIRQTKLNAATLPAFLAAMKSILNTDQQKTLAKATAFASKTKPETTEDTDKDKEAAITQTADKISKTIYDATTDNYRDTNKEEANLLKRIAAIALRRCTDGNGSRENRTDTILRTLEDVLMEFGPTSQCNPHITLTIPVQTVLKETRADEPPIIQTNIEILRPTSKILPCINTIIQLTNRQYYNAHMHWNEEFYTLLTQFGSKTISAAFANLAILQKAKDDEMKTAKISDEIVVWAKDCLAKTNAKDTIDRALLPAINEPNLLDILIKHWIEYLNATETN